MPPTFIAVWRIDNDYSIVEKSTPRRRIVEILALLLRIVERKIGIAALGMPSREGCSIDEEHALHGVSSLPRVFARVSGECRRPSFLRA
jgi:hypothetical protein